MSAPLVALSISESPDLGWLGLGRPHLDEAMAEIARYLLLAGASLAYGGDLRPGGFTRLLFEMVRSYRRDSPQTLPVANYLAWPVHRAWTGEQIGEMKREFDGAGRLLWLDVEGQTLTDEERQRRVAANLATEESVEERAAGFTAMRRRMAADCSARVLLGGKVQGYSGAMPGIAEEGLLTLAARKPLFALGGYGGCTRDLIAALRDHEERNSWRRRGPEETGPGYVEAMRALSEYSTQDLRNGLSREENSALFAATLPPVILRHLLGGLGRLELLPRGAAAARVSAVANPAQPDRDR